MMPVLSKHCSTPTRTWTQRRDNGNVTTSSHAYESSPRHVSILGWQLPSLCLGSLTSITLGMSQPVAMQRSQRLAVRGHRSGQRPCTSSEQVDPAVPSAWDSTRCGHHNTLQVLPSQLLLLDTEHLAEVDGEIKVAQEGVFEILGLDA